MGLRFFKRVKILPFMTLNLTKKGASCSLGGKGGRYTFGSSGTRMTAGIEGTGLYYTKKGGQQERQAAGQKKQAKHDEQPPDPLDWLHLSLWQRLWLSAEEKAFVRGVRTYLLGDLSSAAHILGDHSHPDMQILRGFLALRLGLPDEAYEHFRRAQQAIYQPKGLDYYFQAWGLDLAFPIEINPFISTIAQVDDRGIWLGMAEACRRRGQWEAAIFAASEAAELVPDDAGAKAFLAQVWIESGQAERWDRVLEALAGVPVEEQETAAMSLMRARAMREKGQPGAGELCCKIPKRKAWPNELYRARDLERARCWAAQGTKARLKRAQTELQRLYAEQPEDTEVIQAIASLKERG